MQNMKLIMENWRKFKDDITLDDIKTINESYVFLKKTNKQLLESKNDSPFQRKIKFSEFINLVENKKINIYTAQKMVLDTMEIDAKSLNQEHLEEAVGDVLQKIGQGVKDGINTAKTVIKMAWDGLKQYIIKSILGLIATATSLVSNLTFDKLVNKPYKRLGKFLLDWQIKAYLFFKDPKVKKIVAVLISVIVIIIVCAAIMSLINGCIAASKITQLCSTISENNTLIEASGVCQLAANTTPDEIAKNVFKDQDCMNEFIGIISKTNEGLKAEKIVTDIQFQASGTNLGGVRIDPTAAPIKDVIIDDVAINYLSDQATTDTVRLVDDLKRFAGGDTEGFTKDLIQENTMFKTFLQKYLNLKSQDPNIGPILNDIGQRTKVFNESVISSKFQVTQQNINSGGVSSYLQKIFSMTSTASTDTVQIAPK